MSGAESRLAAPSRRRTRSMLCRQRRLLSRSGYCAQPDRIGDKLTFGGRETRYTIRTDASGNIAVRVVFGLKNDGDKAAGRRYVRS